jgi:SpoVK/Ycf46/Vps4 family AAA+-type ATPase
MQIDNNITQLTTLPMNKDNKNPLVAFIPRENLKHHMALPEEIEERLRSIEREFAAKERLRSFNLEPKKKILFHGVPGCGKTLSAERLAWNLGLPLLKTRFDALLSSYLGESIFNLRTLFEYCKCTPVLLLLDECDFIAKSRIQSHDVGEISRITNMLLTLFDEYNGLGLIVATTNLRVSLDEALFRRFDDIIEIPLPDERTRIQLLSMTLSTIPILSKLNFDQLAKKLDGYSAANIVLTLQKAVKYSILDGDEELRPIHFNRALSEGFSV